jgi:hypothetical protein
MTTDSRQRKRARSDDDDDMPHYIGTNGTNHATPKINGITGVSSHVDSDEWFVGSVDQGTTSSRFIIFNSKADVVASHQIEFTNYYPESGYVCLSNANPHREPVL